MLNRQKVFACFNITLDLHSHKFDGEDGTDSAKLRDRCCSFVTELATDRPTRPKSADRLHVRSLSSFDVHS